MTDLDSIKRDADIAELEFEIAEQRRKPLTYQTCERLAILYQVRDHLIAERDGVSHRTERSRPDYDFLSSGVLSDSVRDRDMRQVWAKIEELVEVVRLNNPKLHSRFMRDVCACDSCSMTHV